MKNISILLTILFLCASNAMGDELQDIRKSIADRVPQVKELWASKQVGEANNGYMKVIGSITPEQAKIVQAENSDRKTMYVLVSQRFGDSLELVGKASAQRIQAQAPAGTMIQTANGAWVAKP
jgi:uncharacterized protein YdbL (DUF1318 family)